MEVHVIGIPPYKSIPADKSERENIKNRKYVLTVETKKQCGSMKPLDKDVLLTVRYERNRGRADGINIVGGIADTLQGILYFNDNQIREMHYYEKNGKGDEYWISVDTLDRFK